MHSTQNVLKMSTFSVLCAVVHTEIEYIILNKAPCVEYFTFTVRGSLQFVLEFHFTKLYTLCLKFRTSKISHDNIATRARLLMIFGRKDCWLVMY